MGLPRVHASQQRFPVRLIALRLATLRWKVSGLTRSIELVARMVQSCLDDPMIRSNQFHYFIRDICEVFVSWGIKPTTVESETLCSEFVQYLIRICANPKAFWTR